MRVAQANELDAQKIAGSVIDALNRRDPDAMLAFVHPDAEFRARLAAVEGRTYMGLEGFHQYFRDVAETFADPHWALDELVGWRGDNLVVAIRFTARGRDSDVPVEVVAPQVWSFRDGRVWRNVTYRSKAEALEAARLSE